MRQRIIFVDSEETSVQCIRLYLYWYESHYIVCVDATAAVRVRRKPNTLFIKMIKKRFNIRNKIKPLKDARDTFANLVWIRTSVTGMHYYDSSEAFPHVSYRDYVGIWSLPQISMVIGLFILIFHYSLRISLYCIANWGQWIY